MDTIGERLAFARDKAGYRSAREAAEQLEWTYSTYASHENGARVPKLHTVRKYARAFGVTPEWLLTGNEKNITKLETHAVDLVPIAGEVQAGHWIDESEASFFTDERLPVTIDMRFDPALQSAFLVRGNSMNKVVTDGDYVIGVWLGGARDPQDGDIVVVRRNRGQLTETSLKRLRIVNGAARLFPESTDPKHQKPINLGNEDDGDHVEIVAIVIGAYRSLA